MKTIKIPTSQATPGMAIADDIYTFNNQLIISANTKLSDKIISRLKFYSINQIAIMVSDDTPDSLPNVPLKNEFYYDKLKETEEFKHFNESLITTSDTVKEQLNNIISNNVPIDTDTLLSQMHLIISNCRSGVNVIDMLHCIREYDDQTYIHSVNVSLICNVLGSWLRFSRKDRDTLLLCGLLHDIGKLTIPHEIISKPEKLTEDEYTVVKTHAIRGYNILRPKNINIHIKMSAMMHHERCDGTGYPMGLYSDQIDKFAKIVMIADVYDAMTAARVYRGPLCPFEVISIFEAEGLAKFDTRFVMTFLEHVNQTYLNSHVRLSDKSEGTIVMMNRNSLSRPLIKVNDRFIDLSREHNLFIESILS